MPQLINNSLTIDEDQAKFITLSDLDASNDSDPDALEFRVTNLVGGRFELVDGNNITVLAESGDQDVVPFTRSDIVANRIRFVQDGSETPPAYTVTVTDQAAESVSSEAVVAFNASNDAPVFEVNQISIVEGGSVVLNNTLTDGAIAVNLQATDEETDDGALVYTVDAVSEGQFERVGDSGVAITEFTQAQVNAGEVVFVHASGSETPPSYTLSVRDGDGGSASREVTLLNPDTFSVNDVPVLTTNTLTLTEGQTVTISSSLLNATDSDGPNDSLVFTIEPVLDDEGNSLLAGVFEVRSESGQYEAQNTFSRSQITAGRVRFRHDGGNTPPQYTVSVSDGTAESEAAAPILNFNAVNDQPVFSSNTLTIEEGGSVILNSADVNLLTTDEESSSETLVYTIERVSNGAFDFVIPGTAESAGELAVGDTFTQADVDAGRVRFTHDGSENLPSYRLTVRDGGINGDPATALAVPRDVSIPAGGFTPINDLPVFEANSLTLSEGDTVTLTTQNLRATDIEDNDASLVFTIASVSNGRFERVIGESIEVLAAPDLATPVSFSQEEVLLGQIRFVHDPANDIAPVYTVQVSDLNDPPGTTSQEAAIDFTAVNDAPVLETFDLIIGEGETVLLGPDTLTVSDEETGPEGIVYSVESIAGGSFVLGDGTEANSFTQADIDEGLISLAHDGGNAPPVFTLRVADAADQAIAIESDDLLFAATNDAPEIQQAALTITEGGEVILSGASNLASLDEESGPGDLTYTISIANADPEKPDFFRVNGVEQLETATFTQAQVNEGQVVFVHGGSNQAPQLQATVTDSFDPEANAITVPVDLQIDFTVVNDEPVFATNTLLSIAEGGSVVLNAAEANLVATDEESGPEALTYSIASVSNGSFDLVNPDTGESDGPLEVGASFTQAEVDAGRVRFTHDGSELAPTYTLTLSDSGVNDDPATALSVSREVVIPEGGFEPVNDAPVFETNSLTLTEGDIIPLTGEILSASDIEDNNADLTFTITSVSNGRFEKVTTENGEELLQVLASPEVNPPVPFTQEDILLGQIRFVHDPADDIAPAYTVQVSDLNNPSSSATQDAIIDFTAVNDAPVRAAFDITIGEGETLVLGPENLAVTDEETGPEAIAYTVDSITGGNFTLADGAVVDSFTQADLNLGAIRLTQDGDNEPPVFSLTATDGLLEEGGRSIVIESGELIFAPSNDAPTIAAAQLTLTEGDAITLTGDNLATTDEESGPEALTYTVSLTNADPEQPDRFIVDGTEQMGPEVSFTQAQVNAGAVQFVHGGSNQAPELTVTVTDSFDPEAEATTLPVDLAVSFTAVNDAPDFSTNTLSITEGGTVVLNALTPNLETRDEETSPEGLVYTIDSVSSGEFQRLGVGQPAAIAPGDTFTQAEVDAGLIQFVHDGGEVAPDYALSVSDQGIPDDPQANAVALPLSISAEDFIKVNDAPEFIANTLTLSEGDTVPLGLANLEATDIDSPISQLRFFFSNVEGGEFLLNGNPIDEATPVSPTAIAFGDLTFVDDGLEGDPSYNVTVVDPGGEAANAPANIQYTPINDNPVILTNAFTITEGQRLTLNDLDTGIINLQAGDDETLDPTQLTYTISDVVGGEFFNFLAAPVNTFTQADLDQGNIVFLHDSSETPPSFTFTVNDLDGGAVEAAASIDFIPVNDPPSLTINSLPVQEGATVQLNTANFNAEDFDNSPEEIAFLVSDLEGGTFVVGGEELSAEGDEGVRFTLAELQAGAVAFVDDGDEVAPSFSISVSDGELATTPAVAAIEFTPVNDSPTAADDSGEGFITDEDASLTTANALLNDLDPDLDDELSVTAVNGAAIDGEIALPSGAILSLLESGRFNYTPNGTFEALAAGETATDSFTYSASDLAGETATATVEILINGVNDAPVAEVDSGEGFATNADTVLTTPSLLANDSDVDAADMLAVNAINGELLTGPVALESGAQVLVNPDGSVVYDPLGAFESLGAGETATDSFEYTVSDDQGGEAIATVEIALTGVNNAPIAANDGDEGFVTDENTAFTTASVLANDQDLDANDTLTVVAVNGTEIVVDGAALTLDSGAQLSFNADGSFNYSPNGAFSALVDGQTATETFEYTVSDGSGVTDAATVELTINGRNSSPVTLDDRGVTNARTSLSLDLLSNDIDPDAGDTLTLTAINGTPVEADGFVTFSSGAGVEINANGTVTYAPIGGFDGLGALGRGSDTFEYTVVDTQGNEATGVVNLEITGLPEPQEGYFNLEQFARYSLQDNGVEVPFTSVEVGGLPLPLLFDETYYLANNPDVAQAIDDGFFTTGYEHFVEFGWLEGRNPSTLYNEDFYLSQNPDVAEAVNASLLSSGFEHFALIGHEEGRNPSELFDQDAYLANNVDIQQAVDADIFGSGFEHFIEFGAQEGRWPNLLLFEESAYRGNNPDIDQAIVDGFLQDGLEHYIAFGQGESRNPSSIFDEDKYLNNNPDVLAAVVAGQFSSGFEHYIYFGRAENRPVF